MHPPSKLLSIVCGLLAPGLFACGSNDDDPGDGTGDEGIPSYLVTGTVLDFETGQPLQGGATVSTNGLVPAPTVSVTGASFSIENVPPHSVFHVLAGNPPTHRSTYNVPVEVTTRDVDGLEVFAVREEFVAGLATAFDVTATVGKSVLIARLVNEQGQPMEGVPGTAFALPDTIVGPYFLDANRAPDPNRSASSSSGWVVFFEVQPGLISVAAADGSGYGMTMPDSPVAATAVTLAEIAVRAGEDIGLPTNVSFRQQVTPIFIARGCDNCHSGGGIGKDLGGLHLNGEAQKMYRELTQEISQKWQTTRVNLQNPEQSLLLTMPSREDPPDSHPNVTFASKADPDYLTILAWIKEGALLD